MSTHWTSRRNFLALAAAGVCASLARAQHHSGVVVEPPTQTHPGTHWTSPGLVGPYKVAQLTLDGGGATYPAYALPQFCALDQYPGFPKNLLASQTTCADAHHTVVGPQLPAHIRAAVYFPIRPPSDDSTAWHLPRVAVGPFPVLLYAHCFRDPLGTACGGSHPSTTDFQGVGAMLRHVASHGCVVVAPDLSWLPGGALPASYDPFIYSIALRALVLTAYFEHLRWLNGELFDGQLDLTRLVLAGHSTGGPAAVEAGHLLREQAALQSLSYGLLAPIPYGRESARGNVLVVAGSLDTLQGATPEAVYEGAGPPKTLVTLPGANHFGYTDLAGPDNHSADVGLYDNNGAIPRDAQQLAGAAYLTALLRYHAKDDGTMRTYLTGDSPIVELERAGAPGIRVVSEGFALRAQP